MRVVTLLNNIYQNLVFHGFKCHLVGQNCFTVLILIASRLFMVVIQLLFISFILSAQISVL
jgi:hypothetical protein